MDHFAELKQLITSSFKQFMFVIGNYLPNMLIATTLLILGLIIAWMVKWVIVRLSDGIDRMIHAAGFSALNLRLRWPLGVILGWIAYWLILLFFVAAAVDGLGLPGLADWLQKFITYLPTLLLAGVFIFGGILLGNVLRDKIISGAHSIGMKQAELFGAWVRIIVIFLALIVGLSQIGLDVRLFEYLLTVFIAALAGSLALAFGLGAGPTLSNVISARYVRKTYQVGQRISINGIEGEILELAPTGVVVDTETGRTFIPAKMFDEEASVLLDNGNLNDE